MNILYLKKSEERRLLAGHLWIYSNEVDVKKSPLSSFKPGELILIKNSQDQSLGIGYINPRTLLCARLLTRNSGESIDVAFFEKKFLTALKLRETLFKSLFYRLIFGEGDYLPGLVIDRFGDFFVVQLNTWGMENLKPLIVEALNNIFKPKGIIFRNDTSSRQLENIPSEEIVVEGEVPEEIELVENKAKFLVSLIQGQKTGWYYDQFLNRQRLKEYVTGKTLLDVFSYIGAWGIQGALAGAKKVVCVDSSQRALDCVQKNAALNGVSDRMSVIKGDASTVLKTLHTEKEKFDVVIVDPPAFIKAKRDINQGMIAYAKVNEEALRLLSPAGILFSASCSMHLSDELLLNILRKASLKTKRPLSIIERLHQAPDHPIHPAIHETHYLKGYVAFVE